MRIIQLFTLVVLFTAACTPVAPPPPMAAGNQPQDLTAAPAFTLTSRALSGPDKPCQQRFVAHELDYITTVEGDAIRAFDGNGAGLAIGDLDGDSRLDIVLANLDGPNAILWNQGDLTFRTQTLSHGQSRAVNIVDIDGDSRPEILFSRRLRARPSLWRNQGTPENPDFVLADFPVKNPYSMSWADLDGDGDLDLVAATYDAEVLKAGNSQDTFAGGGVIYYENREGEFAPTFLALQANTLALLLVDLNRDERLDILAGNDFLQPDLAWLRTQTGWADVQPFAATTQNTMSFDAGDINNDGSLEIFAADMHPYATDEASMAAWASMMKDMEMMQPPPGDPQIMSNVLQVRNESGVFTDQAENAGVQASGWSWSAKFGDLDNDGFLDLYIPNGMISVEMFGDQPGNELVEENLAFRNADGRDFVATPDWGLNSTASGRGMSMADLDNDGDLDIVVNNLSQPAQLFENQLCGGSGLEVDLFWPDSGNSRAVGAQLTLHTSAGVYRRDVRVASGYLSGDPARVHFGGPADSHIERLDIRWPDGKVSSIEEPAWQMLLTVSRR